MVSLGDLLAGAVLALAGVAGFKYVWKKEPLPVVRLAPKRASPASAARLQLPGFAAAAAAYRRLPLAAPTPPVAPALLQSIQVKKKGEAEKVVEKVTKEFQKATGSAPKTAPA